MADSALIVGVVVLITLNFVALIAVYAARYRKVPPNHAMVLFGRRYAGESGLYVWMSGGKFILPIVESYTLISLSPVDLALRLDRVRRDARGATPADAMVEVRATVRIPPDKVEIEKAARNFARGREFMAAGRNEAAKAALEAEEAMKRTVSSLMERLVRDVLGKLPGDTPDGEVADALAEAARPDVAGLGVDLVSVSVVCGMEDGRSGEPDRLGTPWAADVERLDARLRKIEERLGLTPPA